MWTNLVTPTAAAEMRRQKTIEKVVADFNAKVRESIQNNALEFTIEVPHLVVEEFEKSVQFTMKRDAVQAGDGVVFRVTM